MEGIRRTGLQLPWKDKPPDGHEEMDLAFGVVIAMMKDQAAEAHLQPANSIGEAHLHQANSIWDLPGGG